MVKNLPAMQETWVWTLGQEDPLEKGTANHFSVLAWSIPWMEEPGWVYSPWGLKELDTTEWLTLWGFPSGTSGKEPICQCWRCKRGRFDPWVRKIPWRRVPVFFAWRIPWTEEPGGLQSIGLQKVGHDWNDLGCTYAAPSQLEWVSGWSVWSPWSCQESSWPQPCSQAK